MNLELRSLFIDVFGRKGQRQEVFVCPFSGKSYEILRVIEVVTGVMQLTREPGSRRPKP
jgi:hypothetical protein